MTQLLWSTLATTSWTIGWFWMWDRVGFAPTDAVGPSILIGLSAMFFYLMGRSHV